VSVVDLCGSKTAGLAARLALAFGAGAASVLTLPPFSLLALLPIAWSSLFACLVNIRPRRAFLAGFAFGLSNFGLGLS
jgi:apolipoprotein N-acyltransferase